MLIRFYRLLATAALFASMSVSASAQATATVKLDGICSFQALSWRMQETEVLKVGSPATAAVTVSATKFVDSCTPQLFEHTGNGAQIASVSFTAAGAGSPMLVLTKAHIVDEQTGSSSSAGTPTESVTFSFQSFTTRDAGPSSAGKTNVTLSLPDISCTAAVSAWSVGITNTPVPTGGASGAGRPQPYNLQITKPFDACSQSIVQAITGGKTLTTLTLTQVDPTSGSSLTIQLQQNLILGYNVTGAGTSGQTTENIQFKYEKITVTTRVGGSATTATWNYMTETGS